MSEDRATVSGNAEESLHLLSGTAGNDPGPRVPGRVVFEKFVRGLHYLEIEAVLAEAGTHPPDTKPLLPLDMIFRPILFPNRAIRAVDPIMRPEDIAPELVTAIVATPRFTMFGPG